MAKAPRAGLVKTRLCPPLSPDEAAELAGAFLLDAVDQVRSVAAARPAMAYAPVDARAFFHALAPDFALVAQRGEDLGARLSHAFEDLLADGAPGAIVIGSDVPTLPSAVLEAALERLAGADLVLGPSEDGGYYLIGLREPRAALFADMAWSTEVVFEETMRRAQRARPRRRAPAGVVRRRHRGRPRAARGIAGGSRVGRPPHAPLLRGAAGGGQAVTPESRAPRARRGSARPTGSGGGPT